MRAMLEGEADTGQCRGSLHWPSLALGVMAPKVSSSRPATCLSYLDTHITMSCLCGGNRPCISFSLSVSILQDSAQPVSSERLCWLVRTCLLWSRCFMCSYGFIQNNASHLLNTSAEPLLWLTQLFPPLKG